MHVIQTAHVAGFDATTVEADEPEALSAWLGKHGYDASPALTAWLAHYVTDLWKITCCSPHRWRCRPRSRSSAASGSPEAADHRDQAPYAVASPRRRARAVDRRALADRATTPAQPTERDLVSPREHAVRVGVPTRPQERFDRVIGEDAERDQRRAQRPHERVPQRAAAAAPSPWLIGGRRDPIE